MSAASESVLAGQPVYRIFQESIQYPTLIEVDESAQAIVVGPQSDFGSFDLYYPDILVASGIAKATITPDRPWLARTNANLADSYKPVAKSIPTAPGKLLIVPSDFEVPFTGIFPPKPLFEPVVDLLVYTSSLPAILPKRTTRIFKGPTAITDAANNPVSYSIPTYRRRFTTIIIDILDYVGNFDVTVKGYQKYFPVGTGASGFKTVILKGPTNIDNTVAPARFVFKYDAQSVAAAALGGIFEAFILEFSNENPAMQDPSTFPNLGVQMHVELSD